jgi:hypothetical protein
MSTLGVQRAYDRSEKRKTSVIRRITESIRKADYGTLLLEMLVLFVGILLALAADRWNQNRLNAIETAQIVERLKSDTARNIAMFEETLPGMEVVLANVRALFRALETGSMDGEEPAHIESAIAYIDVVPSYPLVFAAYDELIATGRLRQLDDPELIDLLGNQRAEYEAAQAVVGHDRADGRRRHGCTVRVHSACCGSPSKEQSVRCGGHSRRLAAPADQHLRDHEANRSPAERAVGARGSAM